MTAFGAPDPNKVQLLRMRLRPEQAERFFAWASDLADRPEVAAAFQSAADLRHANAAFASSRNPVDLEANQMIGECVAEVELLPAVFHADVTRA